jgi:hypothetical protein
MKTILTSDRAAKSVSLLIMGAWAIGVVYTLVVA